VKLELKFPAQIFKYRLILAVERLMTYSWITS